MRGSIIPISDKTHGIGLYTFGEAAVEGVAKAGDESSKLKGSRFRLRTFKTLFSPKIYMSKYAGGGLNMKTYSLSSVKTWGGVVSKSFTGLSIVTTGYNVYKGYKMDGNQCGYYCGLEISKGVGGMIGAYYGSAGGTAAGALITSGSGGWGAVPGAFVGGGVGYYGGSWGFGEVYKLGYEWGH